MNKNNKTITINQQHRLTKRHTAAFYRDFYTFFTPLTDFLSASLQRNPYPTPMEIIRRNDCVITFHYWGSFRCFTAGLSHLCPA